MQSGIIANVRFSFAFLGVEIKPDAKLSDLDMESLEKLECVMSLEDALKVEIKEDDLWRLKTVQDVIDAVRRVMPSPA
jgi:acyl carrier protein